MSVDAIVTLAVVLSTLGLLSLTRIGPDLIFGAALTVLIVAGVLTPGQALSGFANPGLATVAILYVVVAGLVDTGAVQLISRTLLRGPRSVAGAQLRLMLPVTAMSAFLNNMPVVAMLVPVVQEWARRHRLSVSMLMLPLSYAAILGGTCTLVGTSTNLIVHGLVLQQTDLGPMGFFDIAWVGLPTAAAGIAFVVLTSRWLLPARRAPFQEAGELREYVIEMLVAPSSALIGKTLGGAGLRGLPGAFVAEIGRGETVIPAVAPTERVQVGDRLVFVGAVDSVVDLVRLHGLVPAPDQVFKLDTPRPERRFVEAVVSPASAVVGKTIRDARFREQYAAVVIAVARNGERLTGKVGDISVRAGDTLLLETGPSFVDRHGRSRDFLLMSEVHGASVPRHERAGLALTILAAMVLAAATVTGMLEAALLAAGLMLLTRCTTGASARASIDVSVLLVIGASIGVGSALQVTGAAAQIASALLGMVGDHPYLVLLTLYLFTSLLTEVITNNAAAVLVFPIAEAAAGLGVSFWPFVVAIMMAASASFATPIGYQTNLMVYGPGGYRFTDYLRIGLPLNLLTAAVAVLVIPRVWRF